MPVSPDVPAEQAHASEVYAAEQAVVDAAPLRRFSRFRHITAYVQSVTVSPWWSERFPDAPLEVEVLRRSSGATFSAAFCTDDEVGVVALVNGAGWGLETVLHELAHLAAGRRAGHGSTYRTALLALWRHEAGFRAWVALAEELGRADEPSGSQEA